MKKIDKLILNSFLGPFVLTFLVVVFILLNIHMLKYFDDIIGKDLGWDVIGQLLFYFAIFNTPVALPLAVLLSSLITFGNLGEHFELTAIKSLGISLLRSLVPIFGFVVLITIGAFMVGNYLVPKAALEAYSLLWDIKQKKPALDLRQGVFYNSIPGISIKVNHKIPETELLLGIIIYDHRGRSGNKEVIVADSGRMYTILNDTYLKLELYSGYNYVEGNTGPQHYTSSNRQDDTYRKTRFTKSQIVFDLSSFGLNRTDKKWFQSNRLMRNMDQLQSDMDSVDNTISNELIAVYGYSKSMFSYYTRKDNVTLPENIRIQKYKRDSIAFAKNMSDPTISNAPGFVKPVLPLPEQEAPKIILYSKSHQLKSDSIFSKSYSESEITSALAQARTVKAQLLTHNANVSAYQNEKKIFYIQWHKILAQAIACIAMFLIGAPLGAIIKKGGLGVPVLMSILFFILFYVLSLMGEKWAKQSVLSVEMGMWLANATLFIIGFIFLRQARADARLFDSDFYSVIWDRLARRFFKKSV
ncbi:MAG: LptF/LptG family permease [Cyclobacteriaceae bacterium]|nr:LptF/LptG family permease [Cyclobacteriaceae bacterium]